jgi:hypothetical protein
LEKYMRILGISIARFLTLSLALLTLSGTATFAQSTVKNGADLARELESVKASLESGKNSTQLIQRYDWLIRAMNDCVPTDEVKNGRPGALISPQNTLCINGTLAVSDPAFNRPLASSTGTGVGNGTVGNCTLSGSATAARYDTYRFTLTGCAAFPTEITATLCGGAGCQHVGNVDTFLALYRRVAAGDALTANGGIGTAFSPAAPCTNAVAASDDLGTTSGTPNNTGGATCNQVNNTQCIAPCTSPSNAGGLSGIRRQLGDGSFTLVIAGFGNTTAGSYNLSVDAPGAGCVVSLLGPTAAEVTIIGQVKTAGGRTISGAVITVSGGNLSQPVTARTNGLGYYTLPGLGAGQTYAVSVAAKGYTFGQPSMLISANEDSNDANFTSVE